jgi:hypothetical protein
MEHTGLVLFDPHVNNVTDELGDEQVQSQDAQEG